MSVVVPSASVYRCPEGGRVVVVTQALATNAVPLNSSHAMSADLRPENVESKSDSAAPYKRTMFDRLGPDAGLILRASGFGLTTFGVSLPLGAAIAHKINPQMSPITAAAFSLVCGAVLGACAIGVGLAASAAAGNGFNRFTMGGDSTPYREQYSREQALVMRGEVDEALRSFEAICIEKPEAIDPRIKAAELYAKEKGNYRRAAELFREVQRIPTVTPGEDVYATNRLVDLCAGPLADPGRALVELRRLVERYPDLPAAKHARIALAALKSRVHQSA